MMKYIVVALALALAQAAAFTTVRSVTRPTQSRLMAEYEPMEGESKINLKVSGWMHRLASVCIIWFLVLLEPFLTSNVIYLPRLTWTAPRLPPWTRLKRAKRSTADAGCRAPFPCATVRT